MVSNQLMHALLNQLVHVHIMLNSCMYISSSTRACTYDAQLVHALYFELEQHSILNICMHTILMKHVDSLQTQHVHEHHTIVLNCERTLENSQYRDHTRPKPVGHGYVFSMAVGTIGEWFGSFLK